MARVERKRLEPLRGCIDEIIVAVKLNEVIEVLNQFLPETPEPKYIPQEVVWYDEVKSFATIRKASVNKYNVVVYSLSFVKEGSVMIVDEVCEGQLKSYNFKEQTIDDIPVETEQIHYTGRKGKPIKIIVRETGEVHEFPNFTDGCKFMGHSNSYLHTAISKGRFSNQKYRWETVE